MMRKQAKMAKNTPGQARPGFHDEPMFHYRIQPVTCTSKRKSSISDAPHTVARHVRPLMVTTCVWGWTLSSDRRCQCQRNLVGPLSAPSVSQPW